jgi:hypothetical protein
LQDLTSCLNDRVKLWVPEAPQASLSVLRIHAAGVTRFEPDGETTGPVITVECSFGEAFMRLNAIQQRILEACKGEVEKALVRLSRSRV